MKPIPAIDIRGGRCVRLMQGDYDKETVYNEDPVAQAHLVRAAGLSTLHVVDLDAARTGEPTNRDVIRRIVDECGLQVQVGGGVRDIETVRAFLDGMGVTRVIVGTAAVERPDLVGETIDEFGAERLVIALDVRDGNVTIKGWREATTRTLEDVLKAMTGRGARNFAITDVSRDGTLEGPNVELYQTAIAVAGDARIIASGGVSNLDDLKTLRSIGAHAAIVGRAWYEGKVTLKQLADLESDDDERDDDERDDDERDDDDDDA